jgi:hypothetical protein
MRTYSTQDVNKNHSTRELCITFAPKTLNFTVNTHHRLRHNRKIAVQIYETHMDSYVFLLIFLPELSATSLYHTTDI